MTIPAVPTISAPDTDTIDRAPPQFMKSPVEKEEDKKPPIAGAA